MTPPPDLLEVPVAPYRKQTAVLAAEGEFSNDAIRSQLEKAAAQNPAEVVASPEDAAREKAKASLEALDMTLRRLRRATDREKVVFDKDEARKAAATIKPEPTPTPPVNSQPLVERGLPYHEELRQKILSEPVPTTDEEKKKQAERLATAERNIRNYGGTVPVEVSTPQRPKKLSSEPDQEFEKSAAEQMEWEAERLRINKEREEQRLQAAAKQQPIIPPVPPIAPPQAPGQTAANAIPKPPKKPRQKSAKKPAPPKQANNVEWQDQQLKGRPAHGGREPELQTTGGMFDAMLDAALRKIDGKPWLETIIPRLEALDERNLFEFRTGQRRRAQTDLIRAERYLAQSTELARTSTGAKRDYELRQVEKWEARRVQATAHLDDVDSQQAFRKERHDTLLDNVADRYQNELIPYEEELRTLQAREKVIVESTKQLRIRRLAIFRELGEAEGMRTGLFGWNGKQAVDKIREKLADTQSKIHDAEGPLGGIRHSMAQAALRVKKYEGKMRTVAGQMDALDVPHLRRTPMRNPAYKYSETEKKMIEMWKPEDFVKRWNDYRYEPPIINPVAFKSFVQAAMEAGGAKNLNVKELSLRKMLEYAQAYLKTEAGPKNIARFTDSEKQFIRDEKKK